METKKVLFKEGVIDFDTDGTPFLVASRCKNCGKVFFPSRDFCTECYHSEMEMVALKEGNIHVYTVVHIGVKGFDTPYILAWVTFPEGVRIVAQLDFPANDAESLRIGQKVKVSYGCLRKLDDGTEVMGYKLKPVI